MAVGAIFALVIEGVQALEFTGRSQPLLLWALLCAALIWPRAAARFVSVRTSYPERVLVIGDAAAVVLVKRKLAEDPGTERHGRRTRLGRGRRGRASTGCWGRSTSCQR